MSHSGSSWLRIVLVSVLLSTVLFAIPQPAHAGWIITGDTIPAGEVVDNDVLMVGGNLVIDGTVEGDAVAIGQTVTINGMVRGSVLAVGRTVTLNGEVGGSVYNAGLTLRMGPTAMVLNNVHCGGLLLDTERGSKIGRDLVAAAVRGQIASDIGRRLDAIILLLTFNGTIGAPPSVGTETPDLEPPPAGQEGALGLGRAETDTVLLFVSSGGHKIAGHTAPARATLFPPLAPQAAEKEESVLPQWLVKRLAEAVALLLVGGLVLWLLPSWLRRWTERLRAKPLPATGFGLLAWAIFFNSFAIVLLLSAVFVMVGLWLGSIDLWELAFLFWGVAFSTVVLVLSFFALVVFYVSKVIVLYLVGLLILERLAPRVTRYRIVLLLLGLVIYVLLRSIPTLGWVVEVVVTVLGLGAIWLGQRKRPGAVEEQGTAPEAVAAPAAEAAVE